MGLSRDELIALAKESAQEMGCNLTENKYVPTKLALLAHAFLEADAERERLRFVEFQAGILTEELDAAQVEVRRLQTELTLVKLDPVLKTLSDETEPYEAVKAERAALRAEVERLRFVEFQAGILTEELDAAQAEVELLREELRNRTADLDDARRELDALGVPSNGDKGRGKRFTLATDQRIARLGAELSALLEGNQLLRLENEEHLRLAGEDAKTIAALRSMLVEASSHPNTASYFMDLSEKLGAELSALRAEIEAAPAVYSWTSKDFIVDMWTQRPSDEGDRPTLTARLIRIEKIEGMK